MGYNNSKRVSIAELRAIRHTKGGLRLRPELLLLGASPQRCQTHRHLELLLQNGALKRR